MPPISVLKAAGLYTSPNKWSSTPDGSLVRADNVVIRTANLIEPRRGQTRETNTWGASKTAAVIFHFDNYRYVSAGTSSGVELYYGTAGSTFTSADNRYRLANGGTTTFTPVTAALGRVRYVEAQRSLFFNTQLGIMYLDGGGASYAISSANFETPITDAYLITQTAGTGAWLPTVRKVGYRIVWGYENAHGRLFLGEPSGRSYFQHADGADRYTNLSYRVPRLDQTRGYFFRIYRSFIAPDVDTVPSDDYYLAFEAIAPKHLQVDPGGVSVALGTQVHTATVPTGHGYKAGYRARITTFTADTAYTTSESIVTITSVTATTIVWTGNGSNGSYTYANEAIIVPHSITISDFTPESLLGSPLYTNTSDGESSGDENANRRPPIAKDMAYWQDSMWYANTRSRHTMTLDMLGVGAPNGIQVGDTINIGAVSFTAAAAENRATQSFLVTTTGTPSYNVEQTARSLIACINDHPTLFSSFVTGKYISGGDTAFGKILLEATETVNTPFGVYASRPESWAPNIGSTSATKRSSVADSEFSRIYYSKTLEPESVPLLNFVDVGAGNSEILKIVPMRERLYVFKEDGIFVVSGSPTSGLRQDILDPTVVLRGSNTAIVCGGRIIALTNRGVVAVSEAGVRVLSGAIEDDIAPYTGALQTNAWAAAYETDNLYLLSLDYSASTGIYVYSVTGNAWTKWTVDRTCAAVNPDTDILYLGSTSNGIIYGENKARTYADYVDDDATTTYTISSVPGTTSLVLSSVSGISVGDIITQSTSRALVTAINGTTLTCVQSGSFSAASCGLLNGYQCTVEWNASHAGLPSQLKQFRDLHLHFQRGNFNSADSTARTEVSTTVTTETFQSAIYALLTTLTSSSEQFNHRLITPLEKSRGVLLRVGFSIREGYAMWSLAGWTVEADLLSQRTAR